MGQGVRNRRTARTNKQTKKTNKHNKKRRTKKELNVTNIINISITTNITNNNTINARELDGERGGEPQEDRASAAAKPGKRRLGEETRGPSPRERGGAQGGRARAQPCPEEQNRGWARPTSRSVSTRGEERSPPDGKARRGAAPPCGPRDSLTRVPRTCAALQSRLGGGPGPQSKACQPGGRNSPPQTERQEGGRPPLRTAR